MTTHTEAKSVADNQGMRAHSFDGIQEFDNKLPRWWLWSFYLACIFAVVYWFHFHVLSTGDLPLVRFEKEVAAAATTEAEAEARAPVTNEALIAASNDKALVARGQKAFVNNCTACHKPDAGGLVGPNLTDDAWVHGGNPIDIYKVVAEGIAGTAMVSWKPILGRTRVHDTVAYLLSIRNTNVAGGKAAEGTKHK